MKTPNRPDERPNLEELVQQTSYRERDNALKELNAAIAAILQPRGGYQLVGGSANRHFLPIPKAPDTAINRLGMPDQKKMDVKAQAAYQAELVRITQEEQRLEAAAGKAKNQIEPLMKWAIRIGEDEDMLLLAGAILDEDDRPAVESYIAEHKRFIRTVNRLTDGLRF